MQAEIVSYVLSAHGYLPWTLLTVKLKGIMPTICYYTYFLVPTGTLCKL